MAKSVVHYVYELTRTSEGVGPTRYIGVRTAKNGDPLTDQYMSSSKEIATAISGGHTFKKTILETFDTRSDAEQYECELQQRHMAHEDPDFYNMVVARGEVNLDRLRYRGPSGEHLWFPKGEEPNGWFEDTPRRVTYHDGQGLNRLCVYEGFQPPSYILDEPDPGYEPYVLISTYGGIGRSAYFPEGEQPAGWIDYAAYLSGSREGAVAAELASDRGVDDDEYSAMDHISSMLTLAQQKHQAAISMLGKPDATAIPRLREVLKLLDEVEILADDAATFVDSSGMTNAIKELHIQQTAVRMAIAQLEQGRARSPWATPWPWITLAFIVLALVQMV